MAVLRQIKLIKVEADVNLIEQGEYGDRFFILLQGSSAVHIGSTVNCPIGEKRTLGEAIENYLRTLMENYPRVHWSKVPYAKQIREMFL